MSSTPIRRFLAWLAAPALFCLAGNALAQVDQMMPPVGGPGGGQFAARCATDEILNGFELRVGDDVDAIRAICARATSPTSIASRSLHASSAGGPGGRVVQVVCPDNTPAITSMAIGWEGVQTFIVNSVRLYCGIAAVNQWPAEFPTVAFDGPKVVAGTGFGTTIAMGLLLETTRCAPGLVPVGIHGRSGKWLDAVGFVCGELRLDLSGYPKPAAPAKPKLTPRGGAQFSIKVEWHRPAPANNIEWFSIDQWKNEEWVKLAKRIDARDLQTHIEFPDVRSPDERQAFRVCSENAGGRACSPETWYYPFGKAQAEVSSTPIIAAAQQAAPAPEPPPAPITVANLQAMMARGLELTNKDPLAAELRRRLPDTAGRHGFDIGMGIWAGNTAPGPGKQRYRAATLSESRYGFDIAAAFSLPRNKYAAQSNVGLSIARADRAVARERLSQDDPFFWLGFDIASGIFGDPKAGAQGNTATGPGSQAIRNDLNAAGQRGFDAATAFHLARRYQ
ncbi:MAG TPA: hypothetical protein VIV63_06095 [Steroidobacteraceae bacterium]